MSRPRSANNMHGGGPLQWFNTNQPSASDAVLSNIKQHMNQLRSELEGYQSRITTLNNALQAEKSKAKKALKLFEDLERITSENNTPLLPGSQPSL